jgi:tryptophan synthase alpha chain
MSVARIKARFAELKAKGSSAFVAYIMAGDPDLETAFSILAGLPAAGADIIELGFPFSDPLAEGPTIQAAAERALAAGTKIRDVFALVRRFRERDQATPIILMGYMNPVESMGYQAFAEAAQACGADGLIVVDCPPEESSHLCDALEAQDLALIRLVTPTSNAHRLETLIKRTQGFIYYVSVAGVTGVKSADASVIADAVSHVRDLSKLPVVVGFGIKTPKQAQDVAKIADGCVVGSALVEEIGLNLPDLARVKTKVLEKAATLAQSVHNP